MTRRRAPTSPKADGLQGLAAQMLGKAPIKGRTSVRLCVGVDFGTSTTKAVIHERLGRTQRRWAPRIHGDEHYPSVVVERGIGVSFGPSDAEIRGVRVHRSIKMLLRAALLEGDETRPLPGSKVPIAVAVWGYLVHVIQDLRATIATRFPGDRFEVNEIEWHLGVPLDRDQLALELGFRRVFYRALQASQRAPLDRLVTRDDLIRAYADFADLEPPPRHERSDCFVFAEAAVAVNALRLIGKPLEDGKYLLCDVGAGTMDAAFFWYGSKSREEPIQFYSTSCPTVAGDEFVRTVIDDLRAGEGRTWSADRARAVAIERLHGGAFKGHEAIFRGILQRMAEARLLAFGRARESGEPLDRWESVTGYLVGGGSRMPGVETACLGPLPTGVANVTIPVRKRAFSPQELRAAIDEMTDLHWIAAGLSIPAAEFEDYGVQMTGPQTKGPVRMQDEAAYDDRYPK